MHSEIIPEFNFIDFFAAPWQNSANFGFFFWVALMGFLVTASCGLIGNFLILRRISLIGDAMSHSILPGIVVAFLFFQSRANLFMFLGAIVAGLLTTFMIEFLHSKSKIKQDAAMGIIFSTLFAIGVLLLTAFASHIDLDADCVLYGDIGAIPSEKFIVFFGKEVSPPSVAIMFIVFIITCATIILFYKQLLVSSFDTILAKIVTVNPKKIHYALMMLLSVIVVSAFESVGVILVIAMLILPGATAYLLSNKLPNMLMLTLLHSFLSSIIGIHISLWLQSSIASAMVIAGAGLFSLAWLYYCLPRFFPKGIITIVRGV